MEQRILQLIKLAETEKREWTVATLADEAKCARSTAHFTVTKLQLKGLLKEGHREIVKHDLITVDQAA